MSKYNVQEPEYIITEVEGRRTRLLTTPAFDRFNPSILGLGSLNSVAAATDSIAAIFDLAGFTNFCKQIEPHLSVPVFLNLFLDWSGGRLARISDVALRFRPHKRQCRPAKVPQSNLPGKLDGMRKPRNSLNTF